MTTGSLRHLTETKSLLHAPRVVNRAPYAIMPTDGLAIASPAGLLSPCEVEMAAPDKNEVRIKTETEECADHEPEARQRPLSPEEFYEKVTSQPVWREILRRLAK
jgi:hypothetical protein